MTKATIGIILSGRNAYIPIICICILLILYADFDFINLERIGVVDIATQKYNRCDGVLGNHESTEPRTSTEDSSPKSRKADGTLRNLRLVFLGDSVTRYQYLSLAYYIRYGYWYDASVVVNNLMNAHSFHHPFHPNEDWNEFFIQSNRILHPMEICDCIRGNGNSNSSSSSSSSSSSTKSDILVERRYFYDNRTNNMLVYINMNGIETSPGRGYYGRLKPETIFTSNFHTMVGIVPGMEHVQRSSSDNHIDNDDDSSSHNTSRYHQNIAWEYYTWDDVIRYHIGFLDFHYNRPVQNQRQLTLPPSMIVQPPNAYVLLNAGLHPHDFHNPVTIQNVVDALHDTQLYGTWKTTTYTKMHVLQEQLRNGIITTLHADETVTEQDVQQNEKHNVTLTAAMSDEYMCQALLPHECFNVSWILQLQSPITQYYVDNVHFMEPIYRIMNEEYLHQLSLVSFKGTENESDDTTKATYIPMNRSQILITP